MCLQCFKVIYIYMTFAVFDIFFLITGLVGLQVLQVGGITSTNCPSSLPELDCGLRAYMAGKRKRKVLGWSKSLKAANTAKTEHQPSRQPQRFASWLNNLPAAGL